MANSELWEGSHISISSYLSALFSGTCAGCVLQNPNKPHHTHLTDIVPEVGHQNGWGIPGLRVVSVKLDMNILQTGDGLQPWHSGLQPWHSWLQSWHVRFQTWHDRLQARHVVVTVWFQARHVSMALLKVRDRGLGDKAHCTQLKTMQNAAGTGVDQMK